MRRRVADSIRHAVDDLVDAWISAVRSDPRIHSDDGLTHGQLRDEVPALLREVADVVLDDEEPTAASLREGRVHVYTRFRQGYRARDLVLELSLLRLVLLDFLARVAAADAPTVHVGEFAAISRIVNLYVDEEMRYAMTIYTESRDG